MLRVEDSVAGSEPWWARLIHKFLWATSDRDAILAALASASCLPDSAIPSSIRARFPDEAVVSRSSNSSSGLGDRSLPMPEPGNADGGSTGQVDIIFALTKGFRVMDLGDFDFEQGN